MTSSIDSEVVVADPIDILHNAEPCADSNNSLKVKYPLSEVHGDVTLYSLNTLVLGKFLGSKYLGVEDAISGNSLRNGLMFDNKMFLFAFLSNEGNRSENKVILVFIMTFFVKQIADYEDVNIGDHSVRNAIFSKRESFIFEPVDAFSFANMQPDCINSFYNNLAFSTIKILCSSDLIIELESMSLARTNMTEDAIKAVVEITEASIETDIEATYENITNTEITAPLTTQAHKAKRVNAMARSLIDLSGGPIVSGKRSRVSLVDKRAQKEADEQLRNEAITIKKADAKRKKQQEEARLQKIREKEATESKAAAEKREEAARQQKIVEGIRMENERVAKQQAEEDKRRQQRQENDTAVEMRKQKKQHEAEKQAMQEKLAELEKIIMDRSKNDYQRSTDMTSNQMQTVAGQPVLYNNQLQVYTQQQPYIGQQANLFNHLQPVLGQQTMAYNSTIGPQQFGGIEQQATGSKPSKNKLLAYIAHSNNVLAQTNAFLAFAAED